MTADEVDACLRLLAAYWPGDWPDERCAVWIDAIGELTHPEAMVAIREMGQRADYPTVAKLRGILDEGRVDDGPFFAIGSGHLRPVEPTPRPEYRPPTDEVRRLRDRLRRRP